MDVYFQFRGMLFTWNNDKAAANLQKHGLPFERACEVFLDPLMQLWDASRAQEERLAAVGSTLNRDLLFVVHIEQDSYGRTRLISARFATRSEKNIYENNG